MMRRLPICYQPLLAMYGLQQRHSRRDAGDIDAHLRERCAISAMRREDAIEHAFVAARELLPRHASAADVICR